MKTFFELGVAEDIADSLRAAGIVEAFPIQEQTIPLALKGQDIIGQAKTGTGKTFGFGLPLLQRIAGREHADDEVQSPRALVVVPTRELCVQVFEDLQLACGGRDTRIVAIYGGKAYEGQLEQLRAGAAVIVGTPGRLLDLLQQRKLDISLVSEVVLDEADKMLDLGFLPDVEKLFTYLPVKRHTMLFSATMPDSIISLARRFMTQPLHIRATDPGEGRAQENIKHLVYRAHPLDKDEVIARILQAEGLGKTVIFTRTKRQAAKLQEVLSERGFSVAAVHGDLGQEQREKAMRSFKDGSRKVLIATDVAARGIDVDDVTHVINHTVPDEEKTYLHRVGRTGRAGNTGIAITFVDWDELHKWALIDRALEFGMPKPQETYSSSPHLFTELCIPEGVNGWLPGHSPTGHAGAGRKSEGVGGSAARRQGERKGSGRERQGGRRRRSGGRGRTISVTGDANAHAADVADVAAREGLQPGADATGEPARKPARKRRRRVNMVDGANDTNL